MHYLLKWINSKFQFIKSINKIFFKYRKRRGILEIKGILSVKESGNHDSENKGLNILFTGGGAGKKTGKVGEFCQSRKVGTMIVKLNFVNIWDL